MDSDGKKSGTEELFNIRNISFILMAMAIGAAVYFNRSLTDKKIDYSKLENKQHQFVLKTMVNLAVFAGNSPEKERKLNAEKVLEQIDELNRKTNFFHGLNKTQRLIIIDYLGKKIDGEKIHPEKKNRSSEMLNDFTSLYVKKRPIKSDSPLFETPAGDLARLKLFGLQKRLEELKKLNDKLMQVSVLWMAGVTLFGLFIMGLMFGNLAILLILTFKKPIMKFSSIISKIPLIHHRLLLETPILFLFLMFPMQFVIAQSEIIPHAFRLQFQAIYMPLIFLISIYYFLSNVSDKSLFRLLILEGEWSRLPLEVFWGVIGFIAIFPAAIMTLFITIMIASGGSTGNSEIRMAHPVVFMIEKNPVIIFVMAVVLAPILEEIIFRSFLYGFLRRFFQIPGASLLNGLFFAALHPQGYLAIPALMVLGAGLCLLREMRPGVIAPIITHMMVNGLAITVAFFVFS